jgi:hypothetical protein
MLRLKLHVTVMHKPKPLHIGNDRLDMLGSAARSVNILDPKAKLTTKCARKFMGAKRREGVPQMQLPVGTRGKSGDHLALRFHELTQVGKNEF